MLAMDFARLFIFSVLLVTTAVLGFAIYGYGTLNGHHYVIVATDLYGEHYTEMAWISLAILVGLYFLVKDAVSLGNKIGEALVESGVRK